MNKLVEISDLENIKKMKYLGKGKEGCCYLNERQNIVIKLFNGLDINQKIYFDDKTNSQISFPIDILYDKKTNIIKGYTMNYLNGKNLLNGFRGDLEIKDLKKAYIKMRLIMLYLKDIYMDDLCLENMLFDYNLKKINLIDTSRWYIKYDGQIDNIKELNWQMMSALFRSKVFELSMIQQNKTINEMIRMFENDQYDVSLFLNFLNELEKYISEYKGSKVKTLNDFRG